MAILATFGVNGMNEATRRLVPLTDVQPEPIRWLWSHRFLFGAVNLLEGDPGQAKSTIMYHIAGCVTRGWVMPGCRFGNPPAGVVLIQGEDHLAATVRPGLEAAGADLSKLYVYDSNRFGTRPLTLPDDLGAIEVEAGEVQARLVVIDPFTAFLGGNANSDQSVRKTMGALTAFASRAGLAVVLVRHNRKAGSGNPAYRGAGSIGIIAAARSALAVAPDPTTSDPHMHVLVQTKTNLATAASLSYRTVKSGDRITVEWLGESRCTARDLAGAEDRSAHAEAMWVLYSLLSDGPVQASDVYSRATAAGVAKRTLERAKVALQVRTRKHGSGAGSCWTWELPRDDRLLRPFRERERDEGIERLTYGDEPPLPGDEWKSGEPLDDDGADHE